MEDDEKQVAEKIVSEEIVDGETLGFPQLKQGGGFELLQCQASSRQLSMIKCHWSVKDLKANLGAQSKIYVRPIQKNLSKKSLIPESIEHVTQACEMWKKEFPMHELRDHLNTCKSGLFDSDTDTGSATEIVSGDTTQDVNQGDINQTGDTDGDNDFVFVDEGATSPTRLQELGVGNNIIAGIPEVIDIDNENEEVDAIGGNTLNVEGSAGINAAIEEVVNYCHASNISSTKEVVRLLQSKLVRGRSLEVEAEDVCPEGATNYILVDRHNILETGMDEVSGLEDPFLTLDVQFYGERAEDYGGPRKEFFRLILLEIKEKYFKDGMRELLADEYTTVGLIMGLSILQNGKLPQFLSDSTVHEIFVQDTKSECMKNLICGLEKLGIYQICCKIPTIQEVFKPNPSGNLTLRKMNSILVPEFSPVGSNRRKFETEVYTLFSKYMREVAAGRRGDVTLGCILQFGTATDKEPLLGFKLAPKIRFSEMTNSFLPMANTCINVITLPYASTTTVVLPAVDVLFGLYDEAFSSLYFGNL